MSTLAIPSRRDAALDYLELTKPRITSLVVFTTLVGFVVGTAPGALSALPLLAVLAGTTLVAAGASAVNMLLERDTDALMLRTRTRPLPAGRLRATEALLFGLVLYLVHVFTGNIRINWCWNLSLVASLVAGRF